MSSMLTVKVWSDGMFRAVATCSSTEEAQAVAEPLQREYFRGRVEGARGVVVLSWETKSPRVKRRRAAPKPAASRKAGRRQPATGGRSVWAIVNNVGRGRRSR